MTRNAPVRYGDRYLDPRRPEDRVTLSEIATAAIRLRNRGATTERIALTLGMDDEPLAVIMEEAITRLAAVDAQTVRGRQQAIIADLYNSAYPSLDSFDEEIRIKAIAAVRGVLEYEGKLTGATAPTRVRIGMDQDTFTTTVADDLTALGVAPSMDTPLIEDDEPWANT